MRPYIGKAALVAAVIAIVALTLFEPAFAQRRGGGMRGGGMRGGGMRGGGFGGGGMSRGAARPSVSRPAGGGNNFVARGGNNTVVRRGNTVVAGGTRPVNVGDVNVNRGWGSGGGYNGCCYHPVARGAAIAAGAAVTAAAIGSVYYSLPSSCVVTVVNGVTYNECGSTWYEPRFDGTTTTYVTVSPPR